MSLYFAYGSNLDLAQMRQRCPGARMVGTATLHGYQLAFVGHSQGRDGGVATIQRNGTGGHVPGVLYEMTGPDWDKLDVYEGYPRVYRREVVRVINRAGWTVEAVAYIRNQGDLRPPSPAYRRIIAGGYRYHNLPQSVLDLALATRRGRGAWSR